MSVGVEPHRDTTSPQQRQRQKTKTETPHRVFGHRQHCQRPASTVLGPVQTERCPHFGDVGFRAPHHPRVALQHPHTNAFRTLIPPDGASGTSSTSFNNEAKSARGDFSISEPMSLEPTLVVTVLNGPSTSKRRTSEAALGKPNAKHEPDPPRPVSSLAQSHSSPHTAPTRCAWPNLQIRMRMHTGNTRRSARPAIFVDTRSKAPTHFARTRTASFFLCLCWTTLGARSCVAAAENTQRPSPPFLSQCHRYPRSVLASFPVLAYPSRWS